MAGRTVTMEDVAARAGVSRALVSIVFRGAPGAAEATRARVLQAARDLDYQPDTRASRLGRARTRTRSLGVVFAVGHDFHGDVLDGIYTAAEQADYEVLLSGVTRRRTEDFIPASTKVTVVERHGKSDRDPVDAVLEDIDQYGAKRLVIGIKRRSPVGKALLGSISQQLLLESPIPVLAVKLNAEPR